MVVPPSLQLRPVGPSEEPDLISTHLGFGPSKLCPALGEERAPRRGFLQQQLSWAAVEPEGGEGRGWLAGREE